MARLWSPRLSGLWMHLHALCQIWGQNILHTGDWAENRQAGQLHKKDLGEHLQAGNVHYLQISWCSWQEKLICLSEPNSIVLMPGREEACRLLWVCHWPWVFWKHSKKLSLWILLTKFLFLKVENMFHVSFLVKQRVVCLTVRHTTWNIKSYRFLFTWWWKFLQVDDEVGLPFLEPVSGAQCAIDDWCHAIFSSLVRWSRWRGGGGCQEPGSHLHFLPGARWTFQTIFTVANKLVLDICSFLGLARAERCFGDLWSSHCAPGRSPTQVNQHFGQISKSSAPSIGMLLVIYEHKQKSRSL